ncbi:EcsC family protein [Paraburkholderia sp. Ac-20336]|nr:EcsC family protein [Paraburkholderia sp. Ac-20336]MBN3851210.1 EcsC family protein [Paraburkholderia sp. Ac-20342]NIF56475.1 hypothetical protein [Burkholderia sp. Ax-1724]NIF80661.1 hypothetical protein [Paraburkholderia sp. Cy-641]
MTSQHRRELSAAVDRLEHPHFAARLADYAGQPLNALVEHFPGGLNRRMREVVQSAIFRCLELAINSLDEGPDAVGSAWMSKLMIGAAGGIGGFFGVMALPVELPLTTALMLRAIAEIARAEGEDLSRLETRLACLEVFALGTHDTLGRRNELNAGYYATRLMLTKLTVDVAALISERGAVNASTPIVAKLVGEIVGRFGLMAADMSAASMVPVLGAVGGATLNVIFADHFHRVARGHFTIRRLERIYDSETVRHAYQQCLQVPAPRLPAKRAS